MFSYLQEVHGLTFSATPQQNINILTLGAANGKGGFFPKGETARATALCRALLLCSWHSLRIASWTAVSQQS